MSVHSVMFDYGISITGPIFSSVYFIKQRDTFCNFMYLMFRQYEWEKTECMIFHQKHSLNWLLPPFLYFCFPSFYRYDIIITDESAHDNGFKMFLPITKVYSTYKWIFKTLLIWLPLIFSSSFCILLKAKNVYERYHIFFSFQRAVRINRDKCLFKLTSWILYLLKVVILSTESVKLL